MRGKLMIMIDLEDRSPENENWLADTIALGNSLCDRLEATPDVVVHDIDVLPLREGRDGRCN